jgi:hypothetical protein
MIPENCRKVNDLFVNSRRKAKKKAVRTLHRFLSSNIQFFSAVLADRLVLVNQDLLAAATKHTVAFMLSQHNRASLSIDFHRVATSHTKGLAQFNGESNSAQVVDMSDHSGRFHLYFLTDSLSLVARQASKRLADSYLYFVKIPLTCQP